MFYSLAHHCDTHVHTYVHTHTRTHHITAHAPKPGRIERGEGACACVCARACVYDVCVYAALRDGQMRSGSHFSAL